jgi:hypothetical protein
MPIPAFMLSVVARQRARLAERFFQEYPHDWLVWEPGPWRPTASRDAANRRPTLPPGADPAPRPTGEDAVCFPLPTEAGRLVSVGRSTSNDVVVNDLTVSRHQLTLEATDEGWRVVLLATRSQEPPGGLSAWCGRLNGVRMSHGDWYPLRNRDVLTVGEAALTYYRPEAFGERLTRGGAAGPPG